MLIFVIALLSLVTSGILFWCKVLPDIWLILPTFLLSFVGLFVVAFLLLALFALFVNKKKPVEKDSSFYRRVVNLCVETVQQFLNIRVHISGTEKLPKDEPFLLVSNHISGFDPLLTFRALKKPFCFISKPENLAIPIFGEYAHMCSCLPIDRENAKKALTTIHQAVDKMTDEKLSVAIYPEGTRTRNGKLGAFKNGVFKIAQKAKSAVVVMTVQGTEFISKRPFFQKKDVYLDIVDVLSADEVAGSKTDVLGEKSMTMMKTNIQSHLDRDADFLYHEQESI